MQLGVDPPSQVTPPCRHGTGASAGLSRAAPRQGATANMSPSDDESLDNGHDMVRQSLELHGQRFLSCFDDKQSPRKALKRKPDSIKIPIKSSRPETPKAGKAVKKPRVSSQSGGPSSAANLQGQQQLGTGGKTVSSSLEHESSGGHRKSKAGGKPRDDIEEIMFTYKHNKPDRTTDKPAVNTTALAARERKLFMSAKAGKVHEEFVDVQAVSRRKEHSPADEEEDDLHLSPQAFQQLKAEVERFGASALDKRERKRWQAAMLERLGAKPEKGARTPARIGLGIARANAARESRKLEAAMESGMAKRKGSGKKKRMEHERNRDLGLNELGRGFKAGVLKLKRGVGSSQSPSGGARGTRGGTRSRHGNTPSLGGGMPRAKGKQKPMKLPF